MSITSTCALALVGALVPAVPQDRAPVPLPGVVSLDPALETALDRVHEFERACFEHRLLTPQGLVNPRPFGPDATSKDPVYAFLVDGGAYGSGRHFPGHAGFPFQGDRPTVAHLIECGRYHAGHRAAVELLVRVPDFDPRELVESLGDDVIGTLPRDPDALASGLHVIAARQRRLAPLGRGSLGYVAWGLLMHGPAWERGPDDGRMDRETFVSSVLALGPGSELASWMSERILQPPLAASAEHGGRGIALPRGKSRGRLGFTDTDQRFLQELRARLAAQGPLQAEANGDAPSTERLEEWVATMLERVLRDRGTALEVDRLMKRGALPERRRYWSSLASELPFHDFHGELLREIEALASGDGELSGAARIAELEAAQGTRELSAVEAKELEALRASRDREGRQLVEHMLRLLPVAGGAAHYAAVADALSGELAAALGGFQTEEVRAQLLGSAWRGLAVVDSEQGLWVVEDHLEARRPLGRDGAYAMIAGLVMHRRAGADALLARALEEGDWASRGAAIANPGWMGAERFVESVQALVPRTRDGALGAVERERLRLSLLGGLSRWEGPEARELLLATFEQGAWATSAGSDSWSQTSRGPWLTDVLGLLGPEERSEIVQRGLAPAELFSGGAATGS